MSKTFTNEEIVRKFLASKTFNFEAFGKFVAENGESLATSEDGEFGFVVGTRFIRYCIPPVTVGFGEVEQEEARADVTGI